MPRRASILAVVLVAVAGCIGGPPAAGDTTVPTTSPPTTPPPTTGPTTTSSATTQPSYLAPAVEWPAVEWVGFYAVGSHHRNDFWEPDLARIGFTTSEATSAFFVAYLEGSVVGHRLFNMSGAITTDGSKVPLYVPISGTHTIRIVAHQDSNGDGEFGPGTDRPCRNVGEVVRMGTATLDFSELEGTSTPKPTDE